MNKEVLFLLAALLLLFQTTQIFQTTQKKSKAGGQAIHESVMMHGKDAITRTVKKNKDEVVMERQSFVSADKKYPILNKPVLRGAVSFFKPFAIGFKAFEAVV